MHGIRKDSPADYAVIKGFVIDYLFANGHNVEHMVDDIKAKWGNKVASYEDCIEEIVCNAMMSIATDENSMQKALKVAHANENILDKIAQAFNNLVAKIKEYLFKFRDNKAAKIFAKDVETLEQLAEMFNEAAENAKATTGENKDSKSLMAGEKAKIVNYSNLATAKEMENNGADSETIRQNTGWFKGYDGKWRFEIDDSKIEYIIDQSALNIFGGIVMLDEVIEHNELFNAYPELRYTTVAFKDPLSLPKGTKGRYVSKQGTIFLRNDLKDSELKDTLIHEIQHNVQHIEGFAKGSNVEYWQKKLDSGEIIKNNEQESELKRFEDRYNKIKEEKPEFFTEMKDLLKTKPTVPRAKINFDTLTKVEDEPIEWQEFDKKRDALEEKYGKKEVWGFMDLDHKVTKLSSRGLKASEAYFYTAGEVEARDASKRMNLTAEQRKNTRPDIDRTDVVFAEGSDIKYSMDDNIDKYTNVDLSTLDDNEIKVYNNRGWSYGLFTKEDIILLNEKFSELDAKIKSKKDNILYDGSRIVEVNNKIVLIGGTFNEPKIYNVLTINAKNETDANLYKEWIYNDFKYYRQNKENYIDNCKAYESVFGNGSVRNYESADFTYHKGSKDTGERAVLPDSFKNYGYTRKKQERTRDSGKSQKSISTVSIENTNELSDAKFSMDDIVNTDEAYMTAVHNGDMEAAQHMVSQVAKKAGYDSPILYHGTKSFGFTEFDLDKMDDKRSIFLTDSKKIASTYSGVEGIRRISENYDFDIDSLSPKNVVSKLNLLMDKLHKDDSEYAKYQFIDNEIVDKLSDTLSKDIEYLKDIVYKKKTEYKSDGKIYSQLSGLFSKLDNQEYTNLSTPIYMLLHHTDVFKNENSDKIADIEKNIRLFNKVRFIDVSDGVILRDRLDGYSLDILYNTEAKEELKALTLQGNYSMYGNLEGALVLDAKGAYWNNIKNWFSNIRLDYDNTKVAREDDEFFYLIDKRIGEAIPESWLDVNEHTKNMTENQLQTLMLNKANESLRFKTENIRTTRDIAKFAEDHGYNGVVFKNLADNGGQNSSVKNDELSNVYIFFSSSQIKSADPVTYDDDGNIIPLSERFKVEQSDIRYSIDDSFNDWLDDAVPQGIDFDKVLEINPTVALATVYRSAAKTTESGLAQSKGVDLDGKAFLSIARKVMQRYELFTNIFDIYLCLFDK